MYLSRKNSWQYIINALKHRTLQVTLLVKYYVIIKNYVHTRPVGLVFGRTGRVLETATLLLKNVCKVSHTLNHVLDWGGDFLRLYMCQSLSNCILDLYLIFPTILHNKLSRVPDQA